MMHTSIGTVWRGIPTDGDALFFPSILFSDGTAGGGWLTLRVIGTDGKGGPTSGVLIEFHDVASVCCYNESDYWISAEATSRPAHLLSVIETSPEPARLADLGLSHLVHYLLCGGDMCCEILASDAYRVMRFDDEVALEEEALRRRRREVMRMRR